MVLRKLINRFERLQARHTEENTVESRRDLEDVTYTLCVSTGTRTVEAALAAARERSAPATDGRGSAAVTGVPTPVKARTDASVILTA
ncbi:hypothetical protein B1H18_00065 [Streptomyces tsukubensis]|uniref:DUF5133 domain-containing protein n=2 Tax=Streptomyces tsukubensis TaxID=83656 RepID=A0A1V4AHN8_9ACTN|nr:hypothetical protein B1H18_00065 [Streptomyces tsukubensis]